MKKYYTEISIVYYDEEYDDTVEYIASFFIEGKDKISAIKKITEKTIELLKEETPFYKNITSLNIDTLYETSDDARL